MSSKIGFDVNPSSDKFDLMAGQSRSEEASKPKELDKLPTLDEQDGTSHKVSLMDSKKTPIFDFHSLTSPQHSKNTPTNESRSYTKLDSSEFEEIELLELSNEKTSNVDDSAVEAEEFVEVKLEDENYSNRAQTQAALVNKLPFVQRLIHQFKTDVLAPITTFFHDQVEVGKEFREKGFLVTPFKDGSPSPVVVPDIRDLAAPNKLSPKITSPLAYQESTMVTNDNKAEFNKFTTIDLKDRLGPDSSIQAIGFRFTNGKLIPVSGEVLPSSVLLGDPDSLISKGLLDVFIVLKEGEPPLIRCGRIDTEAKRVALEQILKEYVFVKNSDDEMPCKSCVIRQLNSPMMDKARRTEVDSNAPGRDMVDNEHYHLAMLQQTLKSDSNYQDCNVIHINLPRNQITLGKRLTKVLGGLGAWISGYLFGENQSKKNNLEGLATYANLTIEKAQKLCEGTNVTRALSKLNASKTKIGELKDELQSAVTGAYQIRQSVLNNPSVPQEKSGTVLKNAESRVRGLQTDLKQELQTTYNEIVKAEFSLRNEEEKLRTEIASGDKTHVAEFGNIRQARELLTNQRRALVGQLGIKNGEVLNMTKSQPSPILGTIANSEQQGISVIRSAFGSAMYETALEYGIDTRVRGINTTYIEAKANIDRIDKEITMHQKSLKSSIGASDQNSSRFPESKQIAKLLVDRNKQIQVIVNDIQGELDNGKGLTQERTKALKIVLEAYNGMWSTNDFLYEVYTSQSMPKFQEMMAFEQLDQRLGISQTIHCKTGVDRTAGDWSHSFSQKEMIAQEWKMEQSKEGSTLTYQEVRNRTLSRLAEVATHYDEDALLINTLMKEQGDKFYTYWNEPTHVEKLENGENWKQRADTDDRVVASNKERLDMHLRMRTSFTSAYVGSIGLTQVCTGVTGNKGSGKANPNHQPYKALLPFVQTESAERLQVVHLDETGKATGPTPDGKKLFHLFAYMRGS